MAISDVLTEEHKIDGCVVNGTVELNGEDVYANLVPVHLQPALEWCSEGEPIPKSIFDNVAYGPRIHGLVDSKPDLNNPVGQASEVGLWDEVKDRLDEPGTGLSGGQQQSFVLRGQLPSSRVI